MHPMGFELALRLETSSRTLLNTRVELGLKHTAMTSNDNANLIQHLPCRGSREPSVARLIPDLQAIRKGASAVTCEQAQHHNVASSNIRSGVGTKEGGKSTNHVVLTAGLVAERRMTKRTPKLNLVAV